MSWHAAPAEAWRALGANRLRTALTMLGMIIGVGAVVLMLAVGQGAQSTVRQAISAMGSALLALLAGVLTIICQAGLANFLAPIGLPTLTFPFVLVMWMFLFAANRSRHWS